MTKKKLSLQKKKEILKELFEKTTNEDLKQSKSIMMNWYDFRPGLRNKSETPLFIGLDIDNGYIAFWKEDQLGSDKSDEINVFDNSPFLKIIPEYEKPGFIFRYSNHDVCGRLILNEIEVLKEIQNIFEDLKNIYSIAIKEAE